MEAGIEHTCVLFSDHSIRCWGNNSSGQLGISSEINTIFGDDENEDQVSSSVLINL